MSGPYLLWVTGLALLVFVAGSKWPDAMPWGIAFWLGWMAGDVGELLRTRIWQNRP